MVGILQPIDNTKTPYGIFFVARFKNDILRVGRIEPHSPFFSLNWGEMMYLYCGDDFFALVVNFF